MRRPGVSVPWILVAVLAGLAVGSGPAATGEVESGIRDTLRSLEASESSTAGAAETVHAYIASMVGDAHRRDGDQWYFRHGDSEILAVVDGERLRLMTPVAEADDLSSEAVVRMLEANFERTLGARYALWSDVVWAVHVSPVDGLSADGFQRGLREIVNLQRNYGSSYSGAPPGAS